MKMKSSVHSEEDDFVPELHRNVHPRERPDWEETLSAMARGADVPEIPGDLNLKTCGTTASMKVKHVKKLSFTKGHFPKMAECAHFHYENVEFGSIQLSLSEEQNDVMKNGCESKELVYLVHIACQGKSWIVKRSYEDFRVLDKHLHLCIYDRRFSQLSELPRSDALKDSPESVTQMLMAYLSRLSAIAGNKINCGPALTWMEIDNKGNHLLVHEESSINTPAVGAAHVIKRYTARAPDELTLEVGDIVSVIDMPPKVLSTWWRGKHGFQGPLAALPAGDISRGTQGKSPPPGLCALRSALGSRACLELRVPPRFSLLPLLLPAKTPPAETPPRARAFSLRSLPLFPCSPN